VLIQNGIGIEQDLQRAVPTATVITGCSWIDCTIIDNYRTMRHGSIEKLALGAHEPLADVQDAEAQRERGKAQAHKVVDALIKGGGNATISNNIVVDRWRKNLWYDLTD
jgi:2-dehydropantoate 2-reductase